MHPETNNTLRRLSSELGNLRANNATRMEKLEEEALHCHMI